MIKAILFDFDGVLAETMNDLFFAWKNAFLKYGIEIKKEDYFPLEGTKVIEIAEIISKKYNADLDPDKIVKLKDKFYLMNHHFSFYPGAEDFVNEILKKGIKIAIVSASERHKFENTVPKFFLDKFNCIITGDDYPRGKPSPDPYLKAANKLGLKNEECIIIENSPLGVKSAKNAGMFCIAICSTCDKYHLKEADIIIEKFSDLNSLEIIKNLVQKKSC